MSKGDWKIKSGAIALALIGALFAVGGVESLFEFGQNVSSWLTIVFGLSSLFVAARSYRMSSRI
jgi:hypothetical protein